LTFNSAILGKDGKVVAKGLSKDHNFHAELNCLHETLAQLRARVCSQKGGILQALDTHTQRQGCE